MASLTSRQLRFSRLLELCVLGSLHCSGVNRLSGGHRGANGAGLAAAKALAPRGGPKGPLGITPSMHMALGGGRARVPLCHGLRASNMTTLLACGCSYPAPLWEDKPLATPHETNAGGGQGRGAVGVEVACELTADGTCPVLCP